MTQVLFHTYNQSILLNDLINEIRILQCHIFRNQMIANKGIFKKKNALSLSLSLCVLNDTCRQYLSWTSYW